ncbi:TIGR03084 family metal-binding protein [Streptomyces sp. NPDC050610]|uniref:TIGR03084 family metal-binding protein n=1 Tax=Streptomyces sp. NPDC050610 TaxID=3157097 RepID=UPI0034182B7F
MADPAEVLGDLRAEGEALDDLVARIAPERWATPTPAPGWTIAHQIAHLAWTDDCAVRSTEGAEAFQPLLDKGLAAPDSFVDEGAALGAALPPPELLARWRAGRERVGRALAGQPEGVRLPWYGPPMSVASMATGRLMETWAHGQDVADALGVTREPTARLRHVARIGARARNYAYAVRGLTPPAEEFRVELTAPDGDVWSYGPPGAVQRVTGPALDFCLLVTQRAHRSEVAVTAEGPDAEHWLDIAQAFAGPAGAGREPGGSRREPGGPGGPVQPPVEPGREPGRSDR